MKNLKKLDIRLLELTADNIPHKTIAEVLTKEGYKTAHKNAIGIPWIASRLAYLRIKAKKKPELAFVGAVKAVLEDTTPENAAVTSRNLARFIEGLMLEKDQVKEVVSILRRDKNTAHIAVHFDNDYSFDIEIRKKSLTNESA